MADDYDPERVDSIPAMDLSTDEPVELSAERGDDGTSIVLHVRAPDDAEARLQVLPWELAAIAATASDRMPLLPRLHDMPNARESAPFDVAVGAIERDQLPTIVMAEKIWRMHQRQRAIRAMEQGKPAFDLVLKLSIPPHILDATTRIDGVPGNEVTATALYWTAHLLRSASEKVPDAMRAYVARR